MRLYSRERQGEHIWKALRGEEPVPMTSVHSFESASVDGSERTSRGGQFEGTGSTSSLNSQAPTCEIPTAQHDRDR